MEQTSRLSIVVDTATAKKQIEDFRKVLIKGETDAKKFSTSLDALFSDKTVQKTTKAVGTIGSAVRGMQTDLADTVAYMNTFSTQATKFSEALTKISTGASGTKTAASAIGSLNTQVTKIVAQATGLVLVSNSLNKFSRSLTALTTATAGTSAAASSLSTLTPRLKGLAASTAAATARNSSLASSYTLVNTGLQSNTQYLARANQALTANSSVSVKAQLAQDKLAVSAAKVAAAQSRATAAATRAEIAAKQLEIAEQRLQMAVTNRSNASVRAVSTQLAQNAATSRAAGAAANASSAIDRAAAASVRLGAAQARAASDADRMAAGLNRANGSASTLNSTLNRMRNLVVGSAGAMGGLSVIKTADEMQNLTSQIRLVTNSEEEMLVVREKVRQVSDRNYADVAATTNLYQKSARALSNLGKSQADAVLFTDAVALAMRTGGRSAGEQAAAILQLGQAMGAGVVMGDEFRSISENAPILLDLVSKKLGVLPGQLKEMSREGKISAEVMFEALSENIGILEEMAAKMPVTMAQGFNVAKNAYKIYVDEMMNQTGGMSSVISNGLRGIGQNFNAIVSIIGGVALVAFSKYVVSAGLAAGAARGLGLSALAASGQTAIQTTSVNLLNRSVTAYITVATAAATTVARLQQTRNAITTLSWASMRTAILTTTSALGRYTLAAGGAAVGSRGLGGAIHVVTGAATKLAGVINRHPLMVLAAVLIAIVASTEDANGKMLGMQGALSSVGDALSIVGGLLGDFVNFAVKGFSTALNAVADFINGFVSGSAKGTEKASGGFGVFFEGTEGGFVGILQASASVFDAFGVTVYAATQKALNHVINLVIGTQNKFRQFKSWLGFEAGDQVALRNTNFGDLADQRYNEVGSAARGLIDGKVAQIAADKAARKALQDAELSTAPMSQKHADDYAQFKQDEEDKAAEKARKKAAGKVKYVSVDVAALGGKDFGVSQGGAFSSTRANNRVHSSTDSPVRIGTQVYAPISGTAKITSSKHSGNMLTIEGTDGKVRKVRFLHLDSYDVYDGQQVQAGMGVAKSGNSGVKANGKAYSQHLHTEAYNAAGKRIDPRTTKVPVGKYDASLGKQNAKLAAESAREAARERKALEQEQARAAKEALAKEQEEAKARDAIRREFFSEREKLAAEHNDRMAKIAEANFSVDERKKYEAESKTQYDNDVKAYTRSLGEKLRAYDDYLLTERQKIENERKDALYELRNNKEAMLEGNEVFRLLAEDSIERKYKYDLELYESNMHQQIGQMYLFRATEKQLMERAFADEILEASRATDELKDIRLAALREQHDYARKLDNIAQDEKLLALRKEHFTAVGYLRAQYDLKKRTIDASNASPQMKAAENYANESTLTEGLDSHKNAIGKSLREQWGRLTGRDTKAGDSLEEQLKRDMELVDEARENEYISAAEHEARITALMAENASARRDLKMSEYESTASIMATAFKNMFGEQSKAYKAMFIVEKGFAIARSLLAIHTGIAQASALPFPVNIGAMLSVAAATGNIIATLRGIATPQLSGQAHDGLANVPREGTYLLDAGERVVKPRDNQKLTKFLDGEQSGGTNGRSDVKVFVTNMTDSQVVTTRNSDGDLELKIMKAINQHVPAQLANPSSPIGKSLSGNWQTAPRR